jgi:hypothetical protein
VQIRIEGSDLPGRQRAGSAGFAAMANVHVGVQRRNLRDPLLDPHAGDEPSAAGPFRPP